MFRTRLATALAVSVALLAAGPGQALASHGGGGTTTPVPPPGAPSVSFSPTSFAYGPQAVGTQSAVETITLTNPGTAPLFINGMRQSGLNAGDFVGISDTCVGTFVAAGASCQMNEAFTPTATGTRTATVTVIDSAANSPQIVTMTGTGTSVNGPTPVSVDTTGLTCVSGVCQLGFAGDQLVKNFYYTSFGALGDTAPPFAWSLMGGTLPPGLTLFPSGQLYGTPTATGLFTFTVKVTDPAGKTASQAFSLTISPQPPPLTQGQLGCQHAPSSTVANLTGSAIGGQTPKGQGLGDQSQLTACGGFTVIHASVQNVKLPNGTVLWVTLGGEPIGLIVLNGGSGTMAPWTFQNSLRKQGLLIFSAPPTGSPTDPLVLSGGFA
jgi:hypothetical protein